MAHTFFARQHARTQPPSGSTNASSTFDFEMPPYTSHTARRSPSRSKPLAQAALSSPPSRSLPRCSGNNNSKKSAKASGSGTSSDRALLDMLRSTVACLREKRMDVEALGCLEQGLWLQRRMLGAENPQVRAALEEVVLGLNALAMQFLTTAAAFDQCLALLRKAEAITAPGNFSATFAAPLQVLTLNNLGCCYRKLGKPRAALRYLQEAARVGGAIGESAGKPSKEAATVVVNLSVTHLNLCAIQSQLGRHELALEHAQAAIFHAQDELVRLEEDDGTSGRKLDDGAREEKLVSLAVAYHNLAVELEFNGRGDASLQWFRKALELASRYRERNAALCASFQRALDDAKQKHGPSRPKSVSSSGPGLKPQRPRSSRVREAIGDTSYQATVASKCYRPLRPSASSASTVGAGGSRATASSAAGAAAGPNARRQRPMSASSSSSRARCPVTGQLYGSSTTARFRRDENAHEREEPAINRHWRKLERQYDLDRGVNDDSGSPHHRNLAATSAWKAGGSPKRFDRQRRRPQSASAATSRARFADNGPVGHDQDDDDACGVFEDDAPSDDDSLLVGRKANADGRFEVGRDPERHQRGRRHREALHYSQSATSCASDSDDDEADKGEAGDVSSGYMGEDEDPDLPRQRVSHMAYLRRMKKIAESIRDDMIHSPSKQHTSSGHDNDGKRAPKAVGPPHEPRETVETPRSAPLSKMRAKLERMRSDSLLSLLDQREEGEVGDAEGRADVKAADQDQQHSSQGEHTIDQQDSEHKQAGLDSPAPRPALTPAIVLVEDASVFTTSAQVCEGERQLVQAAAAQLVQRFFRGSSCRQRLQRAKRREEESAEARTIQRHVRRHRDVTRGRNGPLDDDADEEEDEREMLLLQQEEVRDIAACVIQRIYRSRQHQPPALVVSKPLTKHDVTTRERTGDHNRRATGEPRDDVAARRLQSAARRFLVRRRAQRSQARRLSRQYIERKHFDVALARAMLKEEEFLEELSATKIQALVRGHQSRALTESTLAGLHAAASRIQGSFREHRRCYSREASVGARSIAARVLQRAFRLFRRRCEREERQDVEHIAAAAIQHFWLQRRRQTGVEHGALYSAEQFEEDEYLDETRLAQEEAATCIQALSRGHLTRRSLQSLRASAASLSGSASTYSQSELHDQRADQGNATDEQDPSARSIGSNVSFLPRRARELFLQSLEESEAQRLSREEAAWKTGTIKMGVSGRRERFCELLREVERAGGAIDRTCQAMKEMRVIVVSGDEDAVTIPVLVQVARQLDQQLGSNDAEMAQELHAVGVAPVFAFRDVLCAS